jgi:hypothetical protein
VLILASVPTTTAQALPVVVCVVVVVVAALVVHFRKWDESESSSGAARCKTRQTLEELVLLLLIGTVANDDGASHGVVVGVGSGGRSFAGRRARRRGRNARPGSGIVGGRRHDSRLGQGLILFPQQFMLMLVVPVRLLLMMMAMMMMTLMMMMMMALRSMVELCGRGGHHCWDGGRHVGFLWFLERGKK